jgi:Rps23 Pro-64 3,4-dihydroxylase Tpa1-like proline 4-hydroxylase
MTPKQILDSFSDYLIRDERILSSQERALLTTLLQHARNAAGESAAVQDAVRAVIASAVGETVAQRAFTVLGGSIVERILESSPLTGSDSPEGRGLTTAGVKLGTPPLPPGSPPSPQPQPPGSPYQPQPPGRAKVYAGGVPGTPPSPQPQPPGSPWQPQPPGTPIRPPSPQPQPAGASTSGTIVAEAATAVAERPATLPANCIVLDEFLAPQELEELTQYALQHEAEFSASEVVSPVADGGVVNYEHRRSRVLTDLGKHQQVVLERIQSVLPQLLQKLDMKDFSIADVEAQITASNDGDFFHGHSDNGSEKVASRYLTFVYFFHREPRPFEGGDLRIHDARLEAGEYASTGSYQTIVPQQNQIVFFPCELLHEITPVECPSRLFADSRFTLNGWLRR